MLTYLILVFAFINEGFSFQMFSDWFVYESYWFISCRFFWFFRYIIIYCENSNFSFQILVLLIAFSCLMVCANTFSTVLNCSGDAGHFYLVSDFGRIYAHMSLLNKILVWAEVYIYLFYHVEEAYHQFLYNSGTLIITSLFFWLKQFYRGKHSFVICLFSFFKQGGQ